MSAFSTRVPAAGLLLTMHPIAAERPMRKHVAGAAGNFGAQTIADSPSVLEELRELALFQLAGARRREWPPVRPRWTMMARVVHSFAEGRATMETNDVDSKAKAGAHKVDNLAAKT